MLKYTSPPGIRRKKERIFMLLNEIVTGTKKRVRIPNGGSRTKKIEVPLPLLQEVCADIHEDRKNEILVHTYDFESIVGKNACLTIAEGDELEKERPVGEKNSVFFEVSRKSEPTTKATVVLLSTDNEEYLLIDACFGDYRPPYWWKIQDPEKREASEHFWNTHAWCVEKKKEEEEKKKRRAPRA